MLVVNFQQKACRQGGHRLEIEVYQVLLNRQFVENLPQARLPAISYENRANNAAKTAVDIDVSRA